VLAFDLPWAALALPLPLLVWWLWPPYRATMPAVRVPFFAQMAAAARERPRRGAVIMRANWLQGLLAPLCWALLVAAMARPVWVEPPIERIESARDLMLAIDLSQSMEARDFTTPQGQRVDRLTAVKRVVADFMARRTGDRMGLIVFGSTAFPEAPLTLDHATLQALLADMQIGMAGPQTAIGDAIGVAVNMTAHSTAQEKVLILLTDGNDTASRVPPERAASIARERGLVVHTIGIGNPRASGEDKVDLSALEHIAQQTGGRFFRAEDRSALQNIYATLDRLTPEKVKRQVSRPKRELFYFPLAAAGVLVAGYHTLMMLIALARRPRLPPVPGSRA
jgi:Ca-activated chloride channel homolog